MRASRTAGFTLHELLTVVVIIGLIAAIAIGKFHNTREKAYDAAAVEEVRQLTHLAEAYFADHMEYPQDVADLDEYNPSKGIEITRFQREITDGVVVVHIHLHHQNSSHYFHVQYPLDLIEKRDRT